MVKYTLVNPLIEDIVHEGKEKLGDVSKKMWMKICDKNATHCFAYSLKDDKNNLYHFKVSERTEDDKTKFKIQKIDVDESKEKKFLSAIERQTVGGKKKKKDSKKKKRSTKTKKIKMYDSDDVSEYGNSDDSEKRYKERDSSDSDSDSKKKRYKERDSSDSDSEAESYYDKIKYYGYYPWLYSNVVKAYSTPIITYDGNVLYPFIYNI